MIEQTNKPDSALLPLIRKIVPKLLAEDIVSVQPMSTTKPKFEIGKKDGWFWVKMPGDDVDYLFRKSEIFDSAAAIRWCAETLGPSQARGHSIKREWYYEERTFFFRGDANRILFLLRWSNDRPK